MVRITKSYFDKLGRHILILFTEATFIFDIIANICDLKEIHIADEYHITINGKKLIFDQKMAYEDLVIMYQNDDYTPVPLQTDKLSPKERIVLEFDVVPFDYSDWTTEERLHALYELLDLALLLQQVEWARTIHTFIRDIESILQNH